MRDVQLLAIELTNAFRPAYASICFPKCMLQEFFVFPFEKYELDFVNLYRYGHLWTRVAWAGCPIF